MNEKKYSSCQSCGLPFDKDPGKGGTEADGSKSRMYCSYCYREGLFVKPDWTVVQMQEYVRKKLGEYGIPAMLAGLLTKGIPKLERWKHTGPVKE